MITPDSIAALLPPGTVIALRDELPAARPVATQRLWLPGDFPSNNSLLELARAEGWNAGVRHYERARSKRQSAPHRPHARAVASVRAHAAAHARIHLRPCPPEIWVRLAFHLLGHPRYDADAWYLSAKAIADGLQDAGIIGRDGADVHSTEGRCVRSKGEAAALLAAGGFATLAETEAPIGMLVEVAPWG